MERRGGGARSMERGARVRAAVGMSRSKGDAGPCSFFNLFLFLTELGLCCGEWGLLSGRSNPELTLGLRALGMGTEE